MDQEAIFTLKLYILLCLTVPLQMQKIERKVGKFEEVFAWKQITYNIDEYIISEDLYSTDELMNTGGRSRRQSELDRIHFVYEDEPNWNQRDPVSSYNRSNSQPIPNSNDDPNSFYIKYNNVPMGTEKVGDRLFVALPRRRYGIPSTLNYVDLKRDSNTRSPALRPYPNLQQSRSLTSVYRTRADECGRLWMVDTGLMEIPNNPQQIQPPAIVIFKLGNDRQILRHNFKREDIPAANTPTGLASITIDTSKGCDKAFAYVPDLTTFGLMVFSLEANDSWRLSHNYFNFNPTAVNLNIAGHRFQWNDGIFSITLTSPDRDGCRTAYFHPLISTNEFSVSTCILNNKSASNDSDYWMRYSIVGDRGEITQTTMHDYHAGSKVIFFAEIGRDAVSCWDTEKALTPANVAILAQDKVLMSYPADLHVTGDEVWVIANTLPRFGYSRLDPNAYNFYIYRANVLDLISGTICSGTAAKPAQPSYNNRPYGYN